MKRSVFLFLLAAVTSCTNDAGEATTADDAIKKADIELKEAELTPEQVAGIKTQYFVWEIDADKKTIRKNPFLQPHYFNVDTLIAGLNAIYPEVLLSKKGMGHDTLYTEIKNAAYLTERMGSLGAEQYIAQAILNLTAIDGVKYVRIDFKEGSHAAPDVWSRERFADYQEVTTEQADF